jgi:hypothetical protein
LGSGVLEFANHIRISTSWLTISMTMVSAILKGGYVMLLAELPF